MCLLKFVGRPVSLWGLTAVEGTMAWDDLDPKPKKAAPLDLSLLSIEDLQNRIQEYQAEIRRMEEAIRAKEAQRSSADALFKNL